MRYSLSFYVALSTLGMGTIFASGPNYLESETFLEQNFTPTHEIAGNTNPKKKQENGKNGAAPAREMITMLPSMPCPDRWRLSVDFLYLLPTVDDTYYVMNSGSTTSFPDGKRQNNDFGFTPAFRVGGEYAFCETHRKLQTYYTHLSSHQEQTTTGTNLWGTLGRPDLTSSFESYNGFASSDLNLLYQRLDTTFFQQAINCYGLQLSVQPGIEYAYMRLREQYEYHSTVPATGVITQKSRAWGIGPEIGLGMDYNFYQSTFKCYNWTQAFSVTSLFSGSILMGHTKTKNFQQLNSATIVSTQDEHTWRTIPALHASVGLDYRVIGAWVGCSLGIGYEFNTYVRALSRTSFSDDVANSLCQTDYYNFDVQGMYIQAALSF